jgi:hypothetical protein
MLTIAFTLFSNLHCSNIYTCIFYVASLHSNIYTCIFYVASLHINKLFHNIQYIFVFFKDQDRSRQLIFIALDFIFGPGQ